MNFARSVPDPMVVSADEDPDDKGELLGDSVRSGVNLASVLKSEWLILNAKCFCSSGSSPEGVTGEGGTLVDEALVNMSFAGCFLSDEAFNDSC